MIFPSVYSLHYLASHFNSRTINFCIMFPQVQSNLKSSFFMKKGEKEKEGEDKRGGEKQGGERERREEEEKGDNKLNGHEMGEEESQKDEASAGEEVGGKRLSGKEKLASFAFNHNQDSR